MSDLLVEYMPPSLLYLCSGATAYSSASGGAFHATDNPQGGPGGAASRNGAPRPGAGASSSSPPAGGVFQGKAHKLGGAAKEDGKAQ